jgi:two-component system nitrogen regulation response regulator NtrX
MLRCAPQEPPPQVSEAADEPAIQLPKGLLAMSLREARKVFERAYIEAQLRRHNGNISRAAKAIGIERGSLHRKLAAWRDAR